MKRLTAIGAVLAAGVLAAACGSSASSSSGGGSSGGPSGVLTISNESGQQWTCQFNPLNPSDQFLSFGTVYEPLAFVNTLQNGTAKPWLASG